MAASFLSHYSGADCACLLLDVHMPAMDGVELLTRIRRGLRDRLPVVMITGRADMKTKARLKAAARWPHMEKPLDSDLLMATIQSLTMLRPAPAAVDLQAVGLS